MGADRHLLRVPTPACGAILLARRQGREGIPYGRWSIDVEVGKKVLERLFGLVLLLHQLFHLGLELLDLGLLPVELLQVALGGRAALAPVAASRSEKRSPPRAGTGRRSLLSAVTRR